MKRIIISETGGTLSRNVVASLRYAQGSSCGLTPKGKHFRKSTTRYYIIGITSDPYSLALSTADERYLVPPARDAQFVPVVNHIAKTTRAEFLHSSHDAVIAVLARHRNDLVVPTFLPPTETVEACVDKYQSYVKWARAGVPVAESMELQTPKDLQPALKKLGAPIWIRLKEGGGGAGSLPVSDETFAKLWIDHFDGWGKFVASEMLSPHSVTWSSIWKDGKLIVAQSRKRLSWLFGNRTLSGVTGITGAAVTVRDTTVDALAQQAIFAIDPKPHGIFSVDMTYDKVGKPRATEINIGRFFTTVHFFTQAGLNMPAIYLALALGGPLPPLKRRINPLPAGLVWVRGMDTLPVLTDEKTIDGYKTQLERLIRLSPQF
jgi:hypothetical protein